MLQNNKNVSKSLHHRDDSLSVQVYSDICMKLILFQPSTHIHQRSTGLEDDVQWMNWTAGMISSPGEQNCSAATPVFQDCHRSAGKGSATNSKGQKAQQLFDVRSTSLINSFGLFDMKSYNTNLTDYTYSFAILGANEANNVTESALRRDKILLWHIHSHTTPNPFITATAEMIPQSISQLTENNWFISFDQLS